MDQMALLMFVVCLIIMFSAITSSWIVYLKYKKDWMKLFVVYAVLMAISVFLTGFTAVFNMSAPGAEKMPFMLALVFFINILFGLFFVPAALPLLLFHIAGAAPKKWIIILLVLNPLLSMALVFGFLALVFPQSTLENRFGSGFSLLIYAITAISLVFQVAALRKIFQKKIRDIGVMHFIFLTLIFQIITPILSGESIPGRIALGKSVHDIVTFAFVLVIFLDILIFNLIKLTREFEGQNREFPRQMALEFGLTGREMDIVNLLLKGLSSREIGEKLFISKKTVDTHIYNLYKKCGIKNKLELFNLSGIGNKTTIKESSFIKM